MKTVFFVSYTVDRPELLYADASGVVVVDVTHLARLYLAGVKDMGRNLHTHLRYVPVDAQSDRNAIAAALPQVPLGIPDLIARIAPHEVGQSAFSGSTDFDDWLASQPDLQNLIVAGREAPWP